MPEIFNIFRVTSEEKFLSNRKRYQPIALPQDFSHEEMAKDWTLSENDKREIARYRKNSRLFIAIQICAVRVYGRFLNEVNDLSPRIVNYLTGQLGLPPALTIEVANREATYIEHRKNILNHLGFRKYDEEEQAKIQAWLEKQACQGVIPDELFQQAERHLLSEHIILPGPSVLERLVISVCSTAHEQLFERLYRRLSPKVKHAIDELLTVPIGQQRSPFYQLKEYPPSATVSSLKDYLHRYRMLADTGIDEMQPQFIETAFLDYLYKFAKCQSANDLKRFKDHKRYALMICFLLETRKILLDYLVSMHDQYLLDMCRHSKNAYEKKHRDFRKRQKKAIDTILGTMQTLLDWPEDLPLYKRDFWKGPGEKKVRGSIEDLNIFKRLEERGYGDLLLARYPSMRKYFAEFIHLPFAAEKGSDVLMHSIEIIRKLDSGELKKLRSSVPTTFIPRELRPALKDKFGNINRNAWELGLAMAIKDALRSGDLYLPQSKQYVSFWDLMLNESQWQETREASYLELQQPQQQEVKAVLVQQFHQSVNAAEKRFGFDDFAGIENGQLRLKRDDKAAIPVCVSNLQKAIDASMPSSELSGC